MGFKFLAKEEGFAKINALGKARKPFLFIVSFDKEKIYAKELASLDKEIAYSFNSYPKEQGKKSFLIKYPPSFHTYCNAFGKVIQEIKNGNTYLLNLTFKSKIATTLSLKEIFTYAKAPFKLLMNDSFVCFSPEKFIEIKKNIISTYPMKGTIDASIPNAKEKILNNKKEMAEHTMIVDLMRNDLNMVGIKTKVDSFRYIDKIKAGNKELLQVSSKISAIMPSNWHENIGTILDTLTPAGSISGTPKKKTIEIIKEVENYDRGFYTGIFGLFDGKSLISAVMIRAISKEKDSLFYYSGGGITLDSNAKDEYQELIDKIYIPL